jgi:hypothetical protein
VGHERYVLDEKRALLSLFWCPTRARQHDHGLFPTVEEGVAIYVFTYLESTLSSGRKDRTHTGGVSETQHTRHYHYTKSLPSLCGLCPPSAAGPVNCWDHLRPCEEERNTPGNAEVGASPTRAVEKKKKRRTDRWHFHKGHKGLP